MIKEQDLRDWIGEYLLQYLDVESTRITGHDEFESYGLDSVDGIVISGALEERFGVEIDATIFIRTRTLDGLVEDLRRSGLLE